jgi:YegS/Rv2252/BmrU family lipid kinase
MKVRLIINPLAAGGKARHNLPVVISAFARAGESCEVAQTEHPRHASQLARQARLDGVDLLLAMGGDGTFNEVAESYLDEGGRPVAGPELGLIPFGTGGDFRRSFELGLDVEQAVSRVIRGKPRAIDLGLANLVSAAGQPVTRCFINVGSCGITGVVSRLVNEGPKWLGGKATFYLATVRSTLGYRNVPIKLKVDGHEVHRGPTYLAAFANARYFGGGMLIAPEADPHDGVLDCIVLGDLSTLEALSLSSRIYQGTHLESPKASTFRGKHFEVAPWLDDSSAAIELDGENPGHIPLTVDVLPGAINLRL